MRRPRRNMQQQEQRLGDSNEAWAEDHKGRAGEGGNDGGSGDYSREVRRDRDGIMWRSSAAGMEQGRLSEAEPEVGLLR